VDWNTLNRLDAEAAAKEMSGLAAQMAKLLEDSPRTAELVMDLLGRHLGDGIDTETYGAVWEGIAMLFGIGDDAPRLYSWLSQVEQRERLDALAARSPTALSRLLRDSIAIHGPSLQEAYRRWREDPENWEMLQRAAYFDIERGGHRVDVTILKFNGEKISMTLDARSLLLMVERLMNSLSLVASGPFTDEELAGLQEQSSAFWEAVAASKAEVSVDGAQNS
jgi:hypothetical protein